MSLKMNNCVIFYTVSPHFPHLYLTQKLFILQHLLLHVFPLHLRFQCVEICNSIWTIFTPFKMFQIWLAMSAISQELISQIPSYKGKDLQGIILTKLEAKSPVMLIEVIFAVLNKSCFYPPLYVYKTSVLYYKSCMFNTVFC